MISDKDILKAMLIIQVIIGVIVLIALIIGELI